MAEHDPLKLGARPLKLAQLRRIYERPLTVAIESEALGAVDAAHAATDRICAEVVSMLRASSGTPRSPRSR